MADSSDHFQVILQENTTLKTHFAELRRLLDQATAANAQLKEENVTLQQRQQMLQVALEAKSRDFDELLSSYRSISTERTHSEEEVRSRLQEEMNTRAQLQQEINELQEFREVYLEMKREMQSREVAYQVELDSKARELTEAILHFEQRINTLEEANAELQAQVDDSSRMKRLFTIESEKRDLEQRVAALHDELETLRMSHEQLTVEQVDAARKAASKVMELQCANQGLRAELARQQEAASAAIANSAAEAEECQRLQRELITAQAEVARLQTQVDTANLYFASERQLLEQSARQRAQEQDRQRAAVEQKLLDCEKRFGQMESRCHQLSMEQAEIERLANAQVAQAREEASARIAAAERQLEDTIAEFESTVTRHDSAASIWQQTIESLQQEARQSEGERLGLQEQVQELRKTVDRLQQSLEWQSAERDAALQQAAELSESVQDLTNRLQTTIELGAENDRLHLQLSYVQNEVDNLTEEVAAIRHESSEALVKARKAAAEEQDRFHVYQARAEKEVTKLKKALEKQKATFGTTLLRSEQRQRKLALRNEELDQHCHRLQDQLSTAMRSLQRLKAMEPVPAPVATVAPEPVELPQSDELLEEVLRQAKQAQELRQRAEALHIMAF